MIKADTMTAPIWSRNFNLGSIKDATTAIRTGMEVNASVLWCQALALREEELILIPTLIVILKRISFIIMEINGPIITIQLN
jgi:hypothetical protein